MTFSIVVRCPKTLDLGVGAIATQANTNVYYGMKGAETIEIGISPQTCFEAMLKEDAEKETRQVIIIDKNGQTAAFTGEKTVAWKGHFLCKDFVVAGNMLVREWGLKAMS